MFFEVMLRKTEGRISVVRTMLAEKHVSEEMLKEGGTKWKWMMVRRIEKRKTNLVTLLNLHRLQW